MAPCSISTLTTLSVCRHKQMQSATSQSEGLESLNYGVTSTRHMPRNSSKLQGLASSFQIDMLETDRNPCSPGLAPLLENEGSRIKAQIELAES